MVLPGVKTTVVKASNKHMVLQFSTFVACKVDLGLMAISKVIWFDLRRLTIRLAARRNDNKVQFARLEKRLSCAHIAQRY